MKVYIQCFIDFFPLIFGRLLDCVLCPNIPLFFFDRLLDFVLYPNIPLFLLWSFTLSNSCDIFKGYKNIKCLSERNLPIPYWCFVKLRCCLLYQFCDNCIRYTIMELFSVAVFMHTVTLCSSVLVFAGLWARVLFNEGLCNCWCFWITKPVLNFCWRGWTHLNWLSQF